MVIAGLERVSSGTLEVNGHALDGKNEDALAAFRRDTIGIVFQSFHLIPTMTALENVAVPLEFKGRRRCHARAPKSISSASASATGLSHYPGQLSGGEQQRVAIARALASGARIILADEPTGNLDQDTGAQIIDLLFALKQEDGATLLLITHDRALAKRCDRIAEVRDGRIISGAIHESGPVAHACAAAICARACRASGSFSPAWRSAPRRSPSSARSAPPSIAASSKQGQPLLGGDVELALIHREATPQELAFIASKGSVSAKWQPCGPWRAATT